MKISSKKFNIAVLVLLVIVGFSIYGNSFSNKLFWDDDDVITNNSYIRDFSFLPEYFSQNLIAGAGQITNYWRPLLLLSFATDYHIFGLDPAGYHAVNLLWHILGAWLLFLLLERLSKKRWISAIVALIFLVHPLQTEAVTYVAGRADPMSTVFVLASALAYVLFRQKRGVKFIYLSALSFILSLLVKEQSIMLPALLFLIEACFFFDKKNWKKSLFALIPFAVISLLYIGARVTVLNFNDILSGTDYSGVYDSSLKVRLLTFTYVFSKYIALLFAPLHLHMAYEVSPITSIWSGYVLSFALLAIVFVYIFIKNWKDNRLVSFGIAWFLILLLPRTNIISINRPLYEHWLYLPMAGFWLAFILLAGKAIERFGKNKKEALNKIAIGILCAVLLFFSLLTILRNLDWRDPITFYEKNLRYTPNSYIQHNNLGMAYADAGQTDEAEKEYRRSLEISQVYPQVFYNLANVLAQQGKLDEARQYYYRAIGISPRFQAPYNNLLNMDILSRYSAGIEKTLSIMKENFSERYYLVQSFYTYYYLGDLEKAREIGTEIMAKYPDETDIGMSLLGLR